MIATALAGRPQLLIADEPTTALDVTTQAQILDLLRGLRERTGMAIMLITHNLGVIAEMADEVVVMHEGRVVEEAPVDTLFHAPIHACTRTLAINHHGWVTKSNPLVRSADHWAGVGRTPWRTIAVDQRIRHEKKSGSPSCSTAA